jgi:hypothetical protein
LHALHELCCGLSAKGSFPEAGGKNDRATVKQGRVAAKTALKHLGQGFAQPDQPSLGGGIGRASAAGDDAAF